MSIRTLLGRSLALFAGAFSLAGSLSVAEANKTVIVADGLTNSVFRYSESGIFLFGNAARTT